MPLSPGRVSSLPRRVLQALVNGLSQAAKRLVERRPGHRVVSLVPRSGSRAVRGPVGALVADPLADRRGDPRTSSPPISLDHAERVAVRSDLRRVDDYLGSREPPFQGARALAVFCCGRDGLFEVLQLPRAHRGPRDDRDHAVRRAARRRDRRSGLWAVLLISRRTARLLTGSATGLRERQRFDDFVARTARPGRLLAVQLRAQPREGRRRSLCGAPPSWSTATGETSATTGSRSAGPRRSSLGSTGCCPTRSTAVWRPDASTWTSPPPPRPRSARRLPARRRRREASSSARRWIAWRPGSAPAAGPPAGAAGYDRGAQRAPRRHAACSSPDSTLRAPLPVLRAARARRSAAAAPVDGTELEPVEHLREADR